nr:trypsin-like peptidase domain-containing protein [Paraburkholderia silvatlantica]
MGADALLLAVTRVCTFAQERRLTSASGFFFQQGTRLFLVTSRHVMIDVSGGHFPDRLEIEFHVDAENLAVATWLSVPLYTAGHPLWRQGTDDGGEIDVAVIELDRAALPPGAKFQAFRPGHLPRPGDVMPIGASLLIVGFPLGFHDSLHHLPVVRQGVLASAFGLRFQGKGCFVTDARTHRGTSGAPVVLRAASACGQSDELEWLLLGVHSSSIDMGGRDEQLDESLGLNSAWYADILMVLTAH